MSATPDNVLADPEQLIADLQRQLSECKAERDEGLQREIAAAEVLQVINSSPGNLAPIFDAILEKALRVCSATFGMIHSHDNGRLTRVAARGLPAAYNNWRLEHPLEIPSIGYPPMLQRLLAGEAVVHQPDFMAGEVYRQGNPHARALGDLGGARSAVSVALRNDDALHGTIIIFRQEVRPFSDKEIRLLQNFAAQAVIAIENARLLTETREALDQQTATAEILQVINSSPGDLSPVFDAILEKAHILCDVAHGSLTTYDGQHFRGVALRGVPQRFGDLLRQPRPPYPGGTQERLLQGERLIHIPDIAADEPTPPVRRASVEAGARTLLMVPLRKDNTLLGYISAHRREVRPFSDKQIALLQNFAAQAVIAMENARLLNELRQRTSDLTESLQQQTATSEVLSIISSSPGELAPVFQTMLENAVRICEAKFGNLFLIDGDGCHWSAGVDTPRKLAEYFTQRKTFQPTLGSHLDRVMRTKQVSHSADDTAEEVVGAAARLAGARSTVCVPMLKDEALVGAIFIYRTEIRPFTDKQIELLENFAAQAVIAIENARLLNELRQRTDDLGEALEQQTATSEVLKVISSSPGELEPVFQAMLENATRICEAKFGILYRFDGQEFYFAADVGTPHEFADFLRRRGPFRPPPGTNLDLLLQTLDVVRIADDSAGPAPGAAARVASARSVISVPMLKENALIGAITIFRQEVRPFTDKQVELVRNFAAQAVIAIENTRLLNELRESLQQQMATAQVLSVISSSPGQLEPVFQSMLENATRICEAKFGTLYRFDGEKFHLGAQHGTPAELAEFQMRRGAFTPRPGNLLDVVMRTKRLCRTADYAAEPVSSVVTMLGGARSTVAVPMLKDEELIGVIVIYRQEVRPFTDKQIALVQNFAAQAVIAIENARLLNELRQRTDDLAESLEEQTATSEVLKVISSSPGDLEPVFRAMLLNATRICEAKFGTMFLRDDDVFRFAAEVGTPAALAEYNMQRKALVPTPGSTIGKVMHTRQVSHTADAAAAPNPGLSAKLGGARSTVCVPMLKDEQLVGVILIYRQEVRPFTDKQIALLQNFAAQAVIAIENTRLLNELRRRTEDLSKSLEDLRTAQDRLVQTQKLASLGQLTAGIAHEIKNPLNFVNNFSAVSVELINELQEMLGRLTADEKTRAEIAELADTLRDNLDRIVQHGKRADAIVKNMLLHSREGSGEHRPVDINALVEESLNLAYHGARAEKQGFNITLVRSFDPAAGEADVYPQEISRVLINLISNGFYATAKRRGQAESDGYEPTLTAETKDLGDRVEIRIRDNGTGIPAEIREKMFNPFFTTKPAGEGTGLGLSISHDIIVKQHGGSIEVETRPGEFTEFRIVLPRKAA